MATLIIISWRDIPAQVIVKRGRETAKVPLSLRFQAAVDRAAMRAGKGSSDAYLADWKRSAPRPCADDIHTVVAAEAALLEARYSDADLERLIRAKGLEVATPTSAAAPAPTSAAAPASTAAAPVTSAPSATTASAPDTTEP
ncbi:MAG TPA: virulence factor [Steroidobacteraceae bacterium]